jgi:hypothetical protein
MLQDALILGQNIKDKNLKNILVCGYKTVAARLLPNAV